MLELLAKYALNNGLEPEPGFKPKDVRWAIACDTQGRFLELVELGDTELKRNPGRPFPKSPDLSQPELIRGETKSHFLIDSAEVVALYGKNTEDKKVQAKHAFFIKFLREAATVIPDLNAGAACLSDETSLGIIRERMQEQKVKPNEKVTLRIGSMFPLESPVWHDWWRSFRSSLAAQQAPTPTGSEKPGKPSTPLRMRCLVTGELVEPAKTHPKVEKLGDVGGLPTGDVLIGFDKEAFRSYGLEQSANAAVSEQAAAAYRAALNHLIKQHSQRLAGAKVIHWFKEKVEPENDPLPWFEEGQGESELQAQDRARRLLQSIRTGDHVELGGNRFYALVLSGASGRIMVRDWTEGPFEELVENIALWFEDLAIVRRDGSGPAKSPKFFSILIGTIRDLEGLSPQSKQQLLDSITPLATKLWRAAVHGEAIPLAALSKTLARVKIDILQDRPLNHARMGLLRGYHVRKARFAGGNIMSTDLTDEFPHPAYQCGRLMAVLAALQRSALGDVGAGIVQRYYAAASTTPSLVIGRLIRNSQFHLNKLESRGLAYWYEERIADICSKLGQDLPRTLNLEEQSLFALGYYQQMADMRKGKTTEAIDGKESSDE